jgi:hypothetical protein
MIPLLAVYVSPVKSSLLRILLSFIAPLQSHHMLLPSPPHLCAFLLFQSVMMPLHNVCPLLAHLFIFLRLSTPLIISHPTFLHLHCFLHHLLLIISHPTFLHLYHIIHQLQRPTSVVLNKLFLFPLPRPALMLLVLLILLIMMSRVLFLMRHRLVGDIISRIMLLLSLLTSSDFHVRVLLLMSHPLIKKLLVL